MAIRPLAFGVRFRDKGRTLRVRTDTRGSRRYVVEDSRAGRVRRRVPATLNLALQDFSADGGEHATHYWRPSRFGFSDATPVPGSGTFTKGE